jgi:hypothetical protein
MIESINGAYVPYTDALKRECPQDSQEAFRAFLSRRGIAKFHCLYGAVAREIEELEDESARARASLAEIAALTPVDGIDAVSIARKAIA